MIWTLVLGSPVRSDDHQFGTIGRIIVNNGVANQFTVNPSGLFAGPERVVPISDVVETTPDGVRLDISEVEWKAYPAFNIDQLIVSDTAVAPRFFQAIPRNLDTDELVEAPTAEAPSQDRTVTAMAVPLTNKTRVGDDGRLAGLVVDTGIPQQLLLEGGGAVPFDQVQRLDEKQIMLGPPQPRMDSVTPAGSLGDAPRRMDSTTPAGSLGNPPPGNANPGRARRARRYG